MLLKPNDAETMKTLLITLVIWSSFGLLASIWFRRRGHNFLLFAGLGVWMGPLVVLLMRLVVADQNKPVRLVRTGEPHTGSIDVLVGVDGSDSSGASVLEAVELLAPAVRRLRIVTVLDPETANSPGAFSTDDALESTLAQTASAIGFEHAELALVTGRADLALVEHATAEGFDMLVVAHRHHGFLSWVLGSTVERLARNAPVTLVIGPPVTEGSRDVDFARH